MATKKETSGKTEKIAQLKVTRSLEVGVPTKGTMLLTTMGQCIFTPVNKISPEDYKGMKTVMQAVSQIGYWTLCESQDKVRLSVVVPKTKKTVMIDAIRTNMTDAIFWAIEKYEDKKGGKE